MHLGNRHLQNLQNQRVWGENKIYSQRQSSNREGEMDAGTERRATGGIGWEEREGCGDGEAQRQELEEVVGAMEA